MQVLTAPEDDFINRNINYKGGHTMMYSPDHIVSLAKVEATRSWVALNFTPTIRDTANHSITVNGPVFVGRDHVVVPINIFSLITWAERSYRIVLNRADLKKVARITV